MAILVFVIGSALLGDRICHHLYSFSIQDPIVLKSLVIGSALLGDTICPHLYSFCIQHPIVLLLYNLYY